MIGMLIGTVAMVGLLAFVSGVSASSPKVRVASVYAGAGLTKRAAPGIGYPNVTSHFVVTRDGVKLYTQLWLIEPWESNPTPRATVMLRSPYPRIEQDVALPWLEQGYAVVLQDMRGMEYSGGKFSFFKHGGNDSYDTMEWIAAQKFSNGVIFGYGISADGMNCYTEELDKPSWLKAQFPIWATGYGWPTAYQGGALREELVVGWLNTIDRGAYVETVKEQEIYGPWWDDVTIGGKFDRVDVPAVHWAGWFDIFQQLQLETFHGYQHESRARGKSFLVVTPHGHCAWATDVPWFPDSETTLPVDLASEVFKKESGMRLLPKANGRQLSFEEIDHVNFYVMAPREKGSNPSQIGNYWTSLPDWPQPKVTPYYLQPGKLLAPVKPSAATSYDYTYHPDLPVPTWGGNNLFNDCGPRDQKYVNDRPDVLVFESDPLQQPLAITGRITANLFVKSDCEDTDFTVKLLDVYPPEAENEQVLIVDGIIRMKFREGKSKVVPMANGVVYNVSVDLWSSSWIFPKGHRIGVAVSSSNWPRFQAHINRFAPIVDWPKLESRDAHNTIVVDASHPSSIILPVVPISALPQNPNITRGI